MKFESPKRLIREDVSEEDRALAEKVGGIINSSFEQIAKLFDNNLSIEDNFNQSKKDIIITVNTSGTPITAVQFKTDISGNCAGIQVIKAENQTNVRTYPTGCPFISFSESNGVITVNNITNLQANNKYKLKLIIYS